MAAGKGRKIAVFPGQFDPLTNGHLDVIWRGSKLFDQLIVAVGVNPEKTELFSLDQRVAMLRKVLGDLGNTKVMKYTGLTVDFVKRVKADVLLRGIRDVSDLRFEFQMAQVNRAVGGVETIFIMTGEKYALISSSLIRQVMAVGGDVRVLSGVLPPVVIQEIRRGNESKLVKRNRQNIPG
jgi:pantetheine-phosphate adenylyltransferase